MTALTTLMHEAGHAAHFANVAQQSPLFSQERAPTSVAYAENQSMFLDSLCDDAAWRARYARDRDGNVVPWSLLEEDIRARKPYAVFNLRAMLAVPYFEKALYELSEEEVSAEKIQNLAEETEKWIQGGLAGRPLLSVPHILSDESSCYYHGYVLAEMSVHQTREYFMEKHGTIVDNPKVGPILREKYWEPGNSAMFLDLVEGLTGKPLTGDAWVADLKEPLETTLKQEREEYEKAAKAGPAVTGELDLGMRVRVIDGDEVITDSAEEGSFTKAATKFERYVRRRLE
jgi:Zn-dependent oligopeptidase